MGKRARRSESTKEGKVPEVFKKTQKQKGEHKRSPQVRVWPTGEYASKPGFTGNRAICILGMHRSGTSAITRAVNLLGPNIGRAEDLMSPVEGDNPHGFWEHMSLFSFHERLLSHLSSSWDSVLPLPGGWWMQRGILPFREELRRLVESEFAAAGTWMWKDPRTSLLLPLWKDVLKELEVDTGFLICVRNPLDVAASLSRRNNFSKDKSLSLWLFYNLSALFWTDGAKRILLNYDDLLEDWERSLRKVSAFFGIPWPQDENGLRASMTEFIRLEERHSHASSELLLNDNNAAEPIKRLYLLLLEALGEDDILNSERFRREIMTIYNDYLSYSKVFMQPQLIHREHAGKPHDYAGAGLPASVEDMTFPLVDSPRASIIIPVWNHWEYTSRCLRAILGNTHEVTYEVIIVDNGSADRTVEVLAKIENIKIIRNPSNEGYVRACNQGAEIAIGKYLVFLNNDTEPLVGWLRELVETAELDDDVGGVGARLIYPNGLLQEAGGMIFSDGRGWNFGKGDDPSEEIYNVMCEVDYCSAACLLVRKDLFTELGGFDARYSPAYYEDADLCFGLRRIGYKVIYNPDVCIIHHESVTAGTTESLGFRKYLSINRKKFIEKWADELSHQDASPREGRVPVTASRERLAREDITQEDIIYGPNGKKASRRERSGPMNIDKSILYPSFREKEEKAFEIVLRAIERYGSESVGVAWSGGKDSAALLHVIRQAFSGRIPVKVISLLSVENPPEEHRFVERLSSEWGFDLRIFDAGGSLSPAGAVNGDDAQLTSNPETMFRNAVQSFRLKALITVGRAEGKETVSADVYFHHEDDPRYVRVRPMLHFREVDVWHYIKRHDVSLCEVVRSYP